MADEYLVRWLDDSSVAHDLGITEAPDGDHRLAVRNHNAVVALSGSVSALALNATANIINLIAPENYYLHGFNITGDTDGYFELKIDGTVIAVEKITPVKRVINFVFPGFYYVTTGQTILLTAKNTGIITSDYQGSIYRGV